MLGRPSRLATLLLAFTLAPTPAFAQGHAAHDHAPDTGASAHFDRGTTFYGEGDYAAALVEFKRAYELEPTWQVLFNVGQSYFQLRDYANAFVTLQRFASEGGARINKEDRATLDSELPDLTNRVARVNVASNVDGASISVDDQVVGKTPFSAPVLMSAGIRRIVATHEGRAPVEQQVSVGGGDTLSLRLDFTAENEPAPPGSSTSLPASPPPSHAEHSPNYLPTYLSLATAVGGIAVGSIFGVMAMQDKSNLQHACTAAKACPPSSQSDIDAVNQNGTISTVGFAVGGAALALGVGLWVLARSAKADSEPASAKAPPPGLRADAGFGSASISGSF